MKRAILVGTLCLLGSIGFAQDVSYEQVREKLLRGTEKVKIFPKNFYATVTEPDYTNVYEQREDMVIVAYNVYRANPDNPIAAYNYANIVLQFGRMNGDGEVGPNNAQEAIKILQKVTQNTKDADSKELLLKAFQERERTAGQSLTPQDYRDAAETSRALGLLGRAADYEEIARELESAELDRRDGHRR